MLKARFYLSNDDIFFFIYYLLGSFIYCKFNDFNCIFTFFFLSTLNKEIIIIIPNFPFIKSEMMSDYYLYTWYIRVASRVAE